MTENHIHRSDGLPAATLRLLLAGHPSEFDPGRRVGQGWDAYSPGEESDRAYMIRQAEKVLAMRDGAGPAGMSAEEHARLVAVWATGDKRPPIEYFAEPTYAEIRREEERIARRAGLRRNAER